MENITSFGEAKEKLSAKSSKHIWNFKCCTNYNTVSADMWWWKQQKNSKYYNHNKSGMHIVTSFHSLTQKIRYESLPYLPIPYSSSG